MLALDFETYWERESYSLSRMDPIAYVRDARFEPMLLGIAYGGATYCTGGRDDMVRVLEGLASRGEALVGHNMAGFDALVISEHFGIRPPVLWDTIPMMHWTGLSRIMSCSHKSLTAAFGHGDKRAGTDDSDGRHMADMDPETARRFVEYCKSDARQCLANARRMLPYLTKDALRFISITAKMATRPAFVVDRARVEEFVEERRRAAADALGLVAQMFALPMADLDSLRKFVRSSDALAHALKRLSVDPPRKVSEARTKTAKAKYAALAERHRRAGAEAMAEQVERMRDDVVVWTWDFSKDSLAFRELLDHDDPRVRLLVDARLKFNSSAAEGRAKRFLAVADGRPVPVMLCAFKAHTGRYTAGAEDGRSAGLQFQNIGKRDPANRKLREAIRAPEGYKVVACDSSQIEARVLAYVARENGLLAQFAEGRDPYSELAERIFSVPAAEIHEGAKAGDKTLKGYRNVGKTAILSAGYGVGAQKFSDTLLKQGARLADDREEHERLAFRAHSVYRDSHPAIVRLWHDCQRYIEDMAIGGQGGFGGPDGGLFRYGTMRICDLEVAVPSILMPSGYILRYPDLGSDSMGEWSYSVPGRGGAQRTKIYGGLLTNNLVQGLSFQILMWQACRMDEAGLTIHANIHDSFACVVPEADAEKTAATMSDIMSRRPPWASGCPIACEVEIGDDYTVV